MADTPKVQVPVRVRGVFHVLVLAAASFATYWSATGHEFLINWDDRQYVLENPLIRGLSLEHVASAFTSYHVGNYAPLHLVSYMLDFEIWGLRASGFIFTNILLHALNGALLFLLLRRLDGSRAWPFFASLIFLLHPVQVESVVWVSQRKTLLAMMFLLAAVHFHASYKENTGSGAGRYYALSLSCFLMALLSKSVAVILPAILVLYDLCFRGETHPRKLLADKVPYLAAGAVFAVLAVMSHSEQRLGGGTAWHGGSPYATFLTMLPVVGRYVGLIVWPVRLSAVYDPPVKTAPDFEVAAASLLIVLLVLAGWKLYRSRRDLFFWYALFFVGLLPVCQVVPIVTLMNDRYLYFPMLGGGALVGYAFLRDTAWADLARFGWHSVRAALLLLAVGMLTAMTVARIGVWKDSRTLWADAVRKAPGVALTHDAYGEGLLAHGEVDEAIRQFQTALSREPDNSGGRDSAGLRAAYANTHNNLGAAYGRKGMHDRALEQFEAAIRLNPSLAEAHFNRGNALMQKGAVAEASRSFENAVRLNPANPTYAANLLGTREILKAGNVPPIEQGR